MAVNFDEIQAAHLLRRAGFGGTREEIAQLVSMGRQAAVNYLVDYEQVDDSVMEAGLAAQDYLTPPRDDMQLPLNAIQMWWLYRMLYTKRPLVEKMTLFWHDHFATAVSKVNVREIMLNQNYLLRKYALGNFEQMLVDISRDPAMIIWLDNNTNIKGSPNENYARELMELFTTGISDVITGEPSYTEFDIQESARAFTGWTIRRGTYFFNAAQHDYGNKTFMGQTDDFNGDGIIDILVDLPSTGRYMAWKLLEWFAYPNPEPELIEEVAAVYFAHNHNMREVVRYILLSDAFASEKALNATIKNPTEFVVSTLRMLKAVIDFRFFIGPMALMEQVLFNPPTVAGWDWGLNWINTATLLIRYNVANGVASARGRAPAPGQPIRNQGYFDPALLLQGQNATTAEEVVDVFLKVLGPLQVDESKRQTFVDYLNTDGPFVINATTIDKKVRGMVHLMLSLPEFQLN